MVIIEEMNRIIFIIQFYLEYVGCKKN